GEPSGSETMVVDINGYSAAMDAVADEPLPFKETTGSASSLTPAVFSFSSRDTVVVTSESTTVSTILAAAVSVTETDLETIKLFVRERVRLLLLPCDNNTDCGRTRERSC